MNYKIRFAEPKDITEIIELCALHAAYEKAEYTTENKAENLAKSLFTPNAPVLCCVVEIENKIIGYTTFMQAYSTWDANFYVHMDCLFIKDDYRNLGIGEALINKIKEYAKENDIYLMQWQTPIFNERAIKFYYRIGCTAKEKLRLFLKI
jgi:GNAT superfamily N-acetyltransferase